MSIFNECFIHLSNCTWLNVIYMLKHLLVKSKNIFKCFSCFWKVFWFEKFSQKSKNLQLCIFALTHESCLSRELSRENPQDLFCKILKTRGVRDSLANGLLSHEKDLEKFSKFSEKLIFQFSNLWHSRLIRDYLASVSPSRKKDLEFFFQNLGLRVFGNSLGNSFASQLSHEKCVFCKNKVKNQIVFQNFSLSLASHVCPFIFSTSPSLKTTFFTPKTSIILFNLHSKSKKRYGFSLLFILFQV